MDSVKRYQEPQCTAKRT